MNEALKIIVIILAGTLLNSTALRAQTTWTLPASGSAGSGSTAVTFQFRTDGSIVEEGAGTSSLANSDLQSISRFIWYPAMSALRAGYGSSTETVSGIGQYSIALGYQTTATGTYSISLGSSNSVSGSGSVVIGGSNSASGINSTSIGIGNMAGASASMSLGIDNFANGTEAIAIGNYCYAAGAYSVALGHAYALAPNSISMGSGTSSGTYSISAGFNSYANSYDSFVIGQYNLGLNEAGTGPSTGSWVSTPNAADPLFEVGAGTSLSLKADAMVIYKDGNATFQGIIKAAPGGNIPMYSGS